MDLTALAADLPIGSGEVESAHRYLIQNRVKIAVAWWKRDNLSKMLALRVVRANREWEDYWTAYRRQHKLTRTFNYTRCESQD